MIFYGFLGLFLLNYLITSYTLQNDTQFRNTLITDLNTKIKIYIFLVVNVLNCIIEEIIFRHFLDVKYGIVITSLIFGIYHIPVVFLQTKNNIIILSVLKFILTGLGGYLLSNVNITYGLLNTIICHILYNMASTLFVYIKLNLP